MPADNPIRELIRRELLDRVLAGGAYRDRYEIGGVFSLPVAPNASHGAGKSDLWELQGTNAAEPGQSSDHGLALATAGADDDQAIIVPHQTSDLSPLNQGFNIDDEPIVEFMLRTTGDISNLKLLAGLKADLDLGVDDADLALFEYDTENGSDAGNIHALTTNDNTSNDEATDKEVETSTLYRCRIEISSSRVARFYINNVKKATISDLQADTTLKPVLGIQALESSAKTVDAVAYRVSALIG